MATNREAELETRVKELEERARELERALRARPRKRKRKANRPSDEVLKNLLPHVDYEVVQLVNSHTLSGNPLPFDFDDRTIGQTIVNALIESFCIHARNLHEFLTNGKNAKASWFVDESYEPGGLEKSLEKKLHTQIAHLTQLRADDQSEKITLDDRHAMHRQLLHRVRLFDVALDDNWRPFWRMRI